MCRRAHGDFGSQIWRFNQDFNFSSLCYFFCLYGGSEIEEGRIRHIFLRVYSAAPEIREMAWNSTPHTPPHTIYRLIKSEKKTTCGTGTYFMQHLACLWIMHMDVTLCFNSNFTTPLNAQKTITHFNFSFGNFCQLINMSIWMEKGLLIRLKENLLLFSPQRTSKAHTTIRLINK